MDRILSALRKKGIEMRANRRTATLLVAILVAGTGTRTHAQRRPNLPRDDISSAGKIKAIGPGMIHVENVGGDAWLLHVEAQPQDVVLTGSALPTFVKQGMVVQFKGLFTKRGVAAEPLKGVTVITPQKSTKLGVTKDSAGPDTQQNNFSSFINQPTKPEADPSAEETGWYNVTGIVKSNKAGHMSVVVGDDKIRVEMAEDAQVNLNIHDYSIARVGDEVEFEGWHYPGQKKFVHATKLTIRCDKLFGAPLKKKLPGPSTEEKAEAKKKTEKKKKGRKKSLFPL